MARTRAPMTNEEARARAEKIGSTPVGAPEFSANILGLFPNTVATWRSLVNRGKPGPTTPLPDELWMVSGKRPAWPTVWATAYRAAKEAGAKTFRAPKIRVPRELDPLGQKDISELTGKPLPTVAKWIERGVLPEATWTVGGQPAWARGVIEDWWAEWRNRAVERNRTSERVQARTARALVASMKEAGMLDLDAEGLVTITDVGSIEFDPLEVVALASI